MDCNSCALLRAQQLQIDALRCEVDVLKHLLIDAGLFSSGRLEAHVHRRHFADMQKVHPWLPSVTLEGVLAIPAVASIVQKHADMPQCVSTMSAVSKVCMSFSELRPSFVVVAGPGYKARASIFHAGASEWATLPHVPASCRGGRCHAAIISRKLYVHAKYYEYDRVREGEAHAKLECLDLEELLWTSLFPCHSCVDAVASLGQQLYMIGSEEYDWDNGEDHGRDQYTNFECFDTEMLILDPSESHTEIDGAEYRCGLAAAAACRKIYVCGYNQCRRTDVQRYDPTLDTWDLLPSMQQRYVSLSVAAIPPFVYVFGYDYVDWLSRLSGECFDTQLGTWAVVSMAGVKIHSMQDVVACGGKLYLFGRGGSHHRDNDEIFVCQRFNPGTRRLETIPSLEWRGYCNMSFAVAATV